MKKNIINLKFVVHFIQLSLLIISIIILVLLKFEQLFHFNMKYKLIIIIEIIIVSSSSNKIAQFEFCCIYMLCCDKACKSKAPTAQRRI